MPPSDMNETLKNKKTLEIRSESEPGRFFDWRSCLTLAWVLWFGAQYVQMIAAARAEKIGLILKSIAAIAQ